MSDTTLYRLSALAAILSGACIIIGKILIILPNPQAGEIFDFLSPLFGLFATIGLYLWQRKEAGFLGAVSFIILFTGLATIVSLDYFGAFIRLELPNGTVEQLMEGPTGPVFALSGLTFLIGEILFGISSLRAGVYPKIPIWFFMIGFIPVPLVGIAPENVVVAGSVLAGVGLSWWGVSLYKLV